MDENEDEPSRGRDRDRDRFEPHFELNWNLKIGETIIDDHLNQTVSSQSQFQRQRQKKFSNEKFKSFEWKQFVQVSNLRPSDHLLK